MPIIADISGNIQQRRYILVAPESYLLDWQQVEWLIALTCKWGITTKPNLETIIGCITVDLQHFRRDQIFRSNLRASSCVPKFRETVSS